MTFVCRRSQWIYFNMLQREKVKDKVIVLFCSNRNPLHVLNTEVNFYLVLHNFYSSLFTSLVCRRKFVDRSSSPTGSNWYRKQKIDKILSQKCNQALHRRHSHCVAIFFELRTQQRPVRAGDINGNGRKFDRKKKKLNSK